MVWEYDKVSEKSAPNIYFKYVFLTTFVYNLGPENEPTELY